MKDLEAQLEQAMASGAEGEEKLRKEIQRLLAELEGIRDKARKDFQEMEQRLRKEKEKELEQQQKRYEKMIEDLKKAHE